MKRNFTILTLLSLVLAGCSNDGNDTDNGFFGVDFTIPSLVFTGEEAAFENSVGGVNQPSLDKEPMLDEEGNQMNDEDGNLLYRQVDDGNPYEYLWIFGDGSESSCERNPTHIYNVPGNYTVGLRVTRKEDGIVASTKKQLAVRQYVEAYDKAKALAQWAAPAYQKQIAPGVTLKKLVFSLENDNQIFRSNQTVLILVVDQANHAGLKFAVASQANGKSTRKTTAYMLERNALAATNGTMWNFCSAAEAQAARDANPSQAVPSWASTIVTGNNSRDYIRVTNSSGQVAVEVPNFNPNYSTTRTDRRTSAIVIDAQGKLSVINTFGRPYNYESTLTANDIMASGPSLLDNGSVFAMQSNEHNDDRHPRTAFATTTDGKVYMIAVDGRQTDARGMNLRTELSAFCKWLGFTNAISLDGGGSTALCLRTIPDDFDDPFDEHIVNSPSDNTAGVYYERSVYNAILLLDEESLPL